MRIIAKPLYRAFPELDRFSDEHCRSYVAAAAGGSARGLLRWAGAIMLGVAATAIVAVLLSRAFPRRDAFQSAHWAGSAGFILALLATFGVSVLVARDILLRLRVRSILGGVGRCESCHYSLVGLAISPALDVTCPECGASRSVAAYPQSCVPDAGGVLRLLPPPGSELIGPGIWTARRKRIALRSAAGLLLLVTLAGVVLAIVMAIQSASVRADDAAALTIDECMALIDPPGPDGSQPVPPELPAGADRLEGSTAHVLHGDGSFCRETLTGEIRWGRPVPIEDWVAADAFERMQKLELESIGDLMARAKAADLLGLPDASAGPPARPARDSLYLQSCARALHSMGYVMAFAGIERRDPVRFARGFEWILAGTRLEESIFPFIAYSWHIEQHLPIAIIEALRSDGGEALSAALRQSIARNAWRPTLQAQTDFSLAVAEDILRDIYRSPIVAAAPFWFGKGQFQHAFRWQLPWPAGLYWPQRDALRANLPVVIAERSKDPSAKNVAAFDLASKALVAAGPVSAAWGDPWRGAAGIGMWSERDAIDRAIPIVIAIEDFRRAAARLPNSLEELCPRFLPELPKDPFATGTFRYRIIPPAAGADWGPGYGLWSVGPITADDGCDRLADIVIVDPSPGTDPPSADGRGN